MRLFPNWVVKHVRNPQLHTRHWLDRQVEVFRVSPKMTKFEIKEYLVKLYNMPVTKVHTANYLGKVKRGVNGGKYKLPEFKKAYVYLAGEEGGSASGLRYQPIMEQQTEAARASWPARPGQGWRELEERFPTPRKKDAGR